jgi:hypothetical protein
MFCNKFLAVMKWSQMSQTLWNTPKHEYRVQWGGSGAFVAKNTTLIRGTNFCMNWTSLVCFATSFMQLRNDPKCTQTLWNTKKMSLGSNGVDQVRWLRKITMRLRGINFCISCTSSVCFATSFMQLRNDPKHYETHQNICIGCNGVDQVLSLRKIQRNFVAQTFVWIEPV